MNNDGKRSLLATSTISRSSPVFKYVCVFFTLNRSFYPSTYSTTSGRADSSILEEIQVLWSQSYAVEILRCHVPGTWYQVCSKHCCGQCNPMSSWPVAPVVLVVNLEFCLCV